ncbi:hscarg protein [Lipomyces tetrasporus]|uniref:Hscarg protein n=1 Tax=Lipomyces tetrasporus TaxID=54092 RepID=A0AAD7QK71_9ASCO|nr:hscarg protein [Lipomyces tetrasporus]KAJ8096554.1 hscarg protein [Lipomyces tetrasporus]
MAPTMKPIIVIIGATGAQGGSVLLALQATGQFSLRAVTRNLQGEAAQALARSGIEVVEGDATDAQSMERAFAGAWGAFLVTSFWDPAAGLAHDTDLVQGKIMVDAAVAAGVNFVVWSSLHDIEAISGGKLEVPHNTFKNKVEQYIKSVCLDAAFVYAGFYATNWINIPLAGPQREKDGSIVIHTPIRADVALPVIDLDADFGKFVAPAFLDPAKFHYKKVLTAAEYVTVGQMAAAYTDLTGENIVIVPIPIEDQPKTGLRATSREAGLRATSILFNQYGYYAGESLEPTRLLYGDNLNLNSFKDWVRKTGFKVPAAQ